MMFIYKTKNRPIVHYEYRFLWLLRSTCRATDELRRLPYLATRFRQLSFRFIEQTERQTGDKELRRKETRQHIQIDRQPGDEE